MAKKLDNSDIDDLSDDIIGIAHAMDSGTVEISNALMQYVSDIDLTINNKDTNKASSLLTDAVESEDNPKFVMKALRTLDKGLREAHVNLFSILFKSLIINGIY